MRITIVTILLIALAQPASAQKYITRDGFISFYSHAPLEDIKADNNQVASVLDTSTGDIVFQVLTRSFHFVKALMEVHFNNDYMESDKYPKSTFTGKITGLANVDFTKPGTYNVTVDGDLTIHGVTKSIKVPGSIEVLKDGINATSKFTVVPEDYNITIPGVIRDHIAKIVEVTVEMKYSPLGKNE